MLLTPSEAAELLGTLIDEVNRWCHNDPDFQCFRVGVHFKINRARLEDWIDRQCSLFGKNIPSSIRGEGDGNSREDKNAPKNIRE